MRTTHFSIVIVLMISMGLSTRSYSQISIKAGVNFASIAESAYEPNYTEYENKSVVGFQAGLAFDLAPKSVISIQPEILYIQKGGKTGYRLDANNSVSTRVYYNYVEVPVLAKLKLNLGEHNSSVYFLGGPYVGLAVSGKSKQSITLAGQTTSTEKNFTFDNSSEGDRNRRLDWGLSFGGGVKVNSVFVDLRYNLGINNLLDKSATNQNNGEAYRRNRGIGVVLGVEF